MAGFFKSSRSPRAPKAACSPPSRKSLRRKINASYVGRVLRLTLLAPDIVEAILDGRQPAEVTLALLMRPFAVEWRKQAEG